MTEYTDRVKVLLSFSDLEYLKGSGKRFNREKFQTDLDSVLSTDTKEVLAEFADAVDVLAGDFTSIGELARQHKVVDVLDLLVSETNMVATKIEALRGLVSLDLVEAGYFPEVVFKAVVEGRDWLLKEPESK